MGHLRVIALVLASMGGVVGGGTAAELWSLAPVGNPTPPNPDQNPIDAFISAGRAATPPAPPSGRRPLIRRASYDLIGLPPTPAQVEAFVADPRPDAEAFADVVEALLASTQYGEHWGRHWLDVVRYADTAGENTDHPLPHAWRYRNWVIDAFNSDKPYDLFVKEQLAGDILGGESTVATGYLAIARRFGHDIDKSMYLTYEDVIDNLGKAFLGLSISCARCHDHKHDPIPTRDYYALYGVLQSTRFSFPGCEPAQQPRDLVPLVSPGMSAERLAWEQRRDEMVAASAPAATEQAAQSLALKAAAAKSLRVISDGEIPDGGSMLVNSAPIQCDVREGEAIQLSILPLTNHGADTTILDFSITQGGTTWSVADLIDGLAAANPNSSWCFLDTSGDPKFLAERNESVDGNAALKSWSIGGTPSVLANTSADAVKAWTSLPPRTFFVHPGPGGPVAIAWLSPGDGPVTIHLEVKDGHPGGSDGVGWRLEHLADPEIAAALRRLGELNMGQLARLEKLREHAAKEPSFPLAYAVSEGEPQAAKLQLRGNPDDLGEEVPRTYLTALGGGELGGGTSSGRLELAEHIAGRDNPLSSRVMANRIWAWHFGRGIVATPNDFGTRGTPPTHPELLDYLARQFMDNGWGVKAMHRLIMSSTTYQQSASDDVSAARYAGFGRRRLTAEELRDTLLVASGELDSSPAEGHPFPPESSWGFTQHNPFAAEYPTDKRSVYLMRKRNRTSRFFALFNGADPNASTPVRDLTTAPTQALYFMNDPFFHACAEKFAARLCREAPDARGRLDLASRELFARPVGDDEVAAFEAFAQALGATLDGAPAEKENEIWKSYARILLGSNELLYTD